MKLEMDPEAVLMTAELLTLKQASAIAQLKRELGDLLTRKCYSDFECVFCGVRTPDKLRVTAHTPGCVGVKLRDAFKNDNE